MHLIQPVSGYWYDFSQDRTIISLDGKGREEGPHQLGIFCMVCEEYLNLTNMQDGLIL